MKNVVTQYVLISRTRVRLSYCSIAVRANSKKATLEPLLMQSRRWRALSLSPAALTLLSRSSGLASKRKRRTEKEAGPATAKIGSAHCLYAVGNGLNQESYRSTNHRTE
ncbi:hypothetical protein PUN28_010338 [Cardiocondyla obscurior]|uniref:Uncharacterized protein n=1 Tax=Cardiocondyla obscurior TaxID=286306 RepID=A0AAW2FQ83_9HYME